MSKFKAGDIIEFASTNVYLHVITELNNKLGLFQFPIKSVICKDVYELSLIGSFKDITSTRWPGDNWFVKVHPRWKQSILESGSPFIGRYNEADLYFSKDTIYMIFESGANYKEHFSYGIDPSDGNKSWHHTLKIAILAGHLDHIKNINEIKHQVFGDV